MKRKVKAFMLLATLLFTGQQVSAEIKTGNYGEGYNGNVANNVTFSLDTETGVLTLSGSGNMKHWESYTTKKGEGEDFRNFKQYIKSVVFAEGSDIINIGHWAFFNCNQLESITIPSTVTAIARSAFEGCTKLNNVTIPYSVTNICENAFKNCSGLFNLTINRIEGFKQFDKNAFEGMPTNGTVYYPYGYTEADYQVSPWYTNGDSDGQKVLKNCTWTQVFYESRMFVYTTSDAQALALSSYDGFGASFFKDLQYMQPGEQYKRCIVFHEDVTSIPANAFKDSKLSTIVLPSTAKSIGNSAFQGCSKLSSINLPSGVASIGNNAFQGCSELDGLDIPSSLNSLGSYAFDGCAKVTSITLPAGVTSIGESTFKGCSALSSFSMQGNVTSIGNNAFQGCSNLTGLAIPSSLNSLGSYAFDGCAKVTTIALPAGVTSIGEYTFNGCSALSSFSMLGNITTIGSHAFDGCAKVTSITFPASLTSIGDAAFYNCASLSDITIKKAPGVALGNNVFGGNLPEEGTIHFYFGEIDEKSAWFTNLIESNIQNWVGDEIFDPNRVIEYTTTDNKAIVKDQADWKKFGANKLNDIRYGSRYVIFDGNVTTIPANAFEGNATLTSIVLPPTVTKIESKAFYNCTTLESVTLSRDLKLIGEDAFYIWGDKGLSMNGSIKEIRVTNTNVSANIPQLGNGNADVFTSVNENCILYVPMGLEDRYDAYGWARIFFKEKRPVYGYTNFSVSSDAKWGTCILSFDYTLPEGAKAYKCSSVSSSGYLVLTDETSTIKAKTPYVVYAENGCDLGEISGKFVRSNSIVTEATEGKLTGAIRPKAVTSDASNYRYVLQNHKDEGVKFYKIAQGVSHTIKSGRCYLTLSAAEASSAQALGFDFGRTEVETTLDEQPLDGPIYDLEGREVTEMEVGKMYIMNGQKILKIK